jgi:hypothetical protein
VPDTEAKRQNSPAPLDFNGILRYFNEGEQEQALLSRTAVAFAQQRAIRFYDPWRNMATASTFSERKGTSVPELF